MTLETKPTAVSYREATQPCHGGCVGGPGWSPGTSRWLGFYPACSKFVASDWPGSAEASIHSIVSQKKDMYCFHIIFTEGLS